MTLWPKLPRPPASHPPATFRGEPSKPLRFRSLKLLVMLLLATAGVIAFGIDLLDGEVTSHKYGRFVAHDQPIGFGLVVVAFLFFSAFVGLGWLMWAWQVHESRRDYRTPYKAPLVEPDKIQSMAGLTPP